jgi:hypothetical protein
MFRPKSLGSQMVARPRRLGHARPKYQVFFFKKKRKDRISIEGMVNS